MKDNKRVSLFIDTATKALALGAYVGDEGDTLTLENPKEALEKTNLGIEALSRRMGFSLSDVDDFYCLLGPGSNTGIRLGLTIPRTIYAFNPSISLYGIETLRLFLGHNTDGKSVLSDRNGNLFLETRKDGSDTFERVDKADIDARFPMDDTVIVEDSDTLAREELRGRNLIVINTVAQMMADRDLFEDYSDREEDFLPVYTQVL